MATILPRPSRPSLSPPTGPLPALPVSKMRDHGVATEASAAFSAASASHSRRGSAASLRPNAGSRAVSSSALPTRAQAKSKPGSTSTLPTLNTSGEAAAAGTVTPGKTLRKTISIGSFPQPPRGVGRSGSNPSSPLSAGPVNMSPTIEQRMLASGKAIPLRDSSLKKRFPVTPSGSRQVSSARSPLSPLSATPSLLNGSGDNKSVTSSGLLSLPSPPQSRTSSAQGSYATGGTTFEDIDDEEPRGREQAPESKSRADAQGSHKDGKGNVVVSVRVRPDVRDDAAKSEREWAVDGRKSTIEYKGREGGTYLYDNVFSTNDNNARVYDSAAKRLVRRVMEGYHGTVFAYGMTGTGKTFSMQGTARSPGVIPLAITDIFSFIRETPQREFLLRVSYLEIYNEKIHDLLSAPTAGGLGAAAGPQEEIKLREDSKRGVYATPLKEEIVQSPTQLLRVIARGDNSRRTAGTQYNARSSRSHAVVQIVVESRERVAVGKASDGKRPPAILPGGVRVSTLSLIDLAGSEKAAENKERRTEGAHINKSLLTLGTVIARLSGDREKSSNAADKEKHLPYRDSKLTRLLQPALSGNSLVSILCTVQMGATGSVAAANSHTGETLNTLKFASRAKNNIVSHAKKAEEAIGTGGDAGSRALLDRYRMEISDLRKQLEVQSQAQNKARVEEEEKARELEADKRHEEQMLEMQLARTALKERIEHLNRLILSSKSLGVNANRSFSALSVRNRGSLASNNDPNANPLSARSSATHPLPGIAGLKRTASGGSAASHPTSPGTGTLEGCSEEEDSLGENGDGTATQAVQIRALQADLADKNRYIGTLEKRLLQARRSSQSRVSLSLAHRHTASDESGPTQLLKEKDAEIADLRGRLDDKDRMIAALRSAARNRDIAELKPDGGGGSAPSTPALSGSPDSRRKSSSHRRSGSSHTASSVNGTYKPPKSPPLSLLGHAADKRAPRPAGGEEMMRILDEMINENADGRGARPVPVRTVGEAL